MEGKKRTLSLHSFFSSPFLSYSLTTDSLSLSRILSAFIFILVMKEAVAYSEAGCLNFYHNLGDVILKPRTKMVDEGLYASSIFPLVI